MNRRVLHPRAYGARSIPFYAPPPPLSHKQLNGLGRSNVISEVGSLCASGSGSSPAQPWFTVSTLLPCITLRPCHALCERHRQCQRSSPSPAQSTPRPPGRCGFATSTLRSCCAPTALHLRSRFVPCPLPRAAHGTCSEAKFRASAPCGTPPCGVFSSLSPAADSGGPDGTCTASTLAAGSVPGHPETRRRRRPRGSSVSSIRLSQPGRSTSSCLHHAPHRHIPQAGKRHAHGVTHRCGLRPHRTAVSRASVLAFGSAETRRTASRPLSRRRQAAPASSRAQF